MQQLSVFLIIVISLVSLAVYFHYNREQQSFSKTLFGLHSEIHMKHSANYYEKYS